MNTSTTSTTTGDSVTAATSLTSSTSTNDSVASHDPSRSTGSAGRSSVRAASPVAAHHRSTPVPIRTRSTADSPKALRAEPSHPEPASPRIVYGRGTITQLPAELSRLGVSSPLIVSSPSRIPLARHIQSLISNLNSRILDSAVVNVPARVVDDAVSRIDGRDVVISVGGASAVGLAKAIGCRKGIPHVCIPTTYSGSEMMPLLLDACPARHGDMAESGVESSSTKPDSRQRRDRENASSTTRRSKAPRTTSVRDPKVLPSVVIYDEDLTSSLPKRISAPSDEAAVARSTKPRKEDDNAQWSYIHLPGV